MSTQTDEVSRRMEALRAYDVIGQPPRRELQAVVDLVSRICDAPMAAINLITDIDHQQVAAIGMDPSVCSLDDSMCAVILHEDAPVVVPDALVDERFRDNPFVSGVLGNVRFYAAHKLVTPEGVTVGTLCVFDDRPRVLDADQLWALATLADRVVDVLELSLRTRELTQSLADMQTLRDELEQSNDRLASFAGQVSHDLKSPLTSVSLSLGMLREQLLITGRETDRPEHQRTGNDALWLIDRAISGSTRMATLIDDVLEFAKLGGSLHHGSVDLDQVVGDVCVDLDGALDGVTLRIDPLPVVHGDEVQLRSLLQNLLSNAAKFADPSRPALVRIGARRGDRGGWRVEVTDNGRGVPEDERLRIFEPLARADDQVSGTGIGLATARRVVEAHQGQIGLDSVPGGGSTFWFELPS